MQQMTMSRMFPEVLWELNCSKRRKAVRNALVALVTRIILPLT